MAVDPQIQKQLPARLLVLAKVSIDRAGAHLLAG